MKKDYSENIKLYLDKLKKTIDILDLEQWNNFINLLEDACETGKQIFIMGNGGSAATASHYVCDFNKGISYGKEKPLAQSHEETSWSQNRRGNFVITAK